MIDHVNGGEDESVEDHDDGDLGLLESVDQRERERAEEVGDLDVVVGLAAQTDDREDREEPEGDADADLLRPDHGERGEDADVDDDERVAQVAPAVPVQEEQVGEDPDRDEVEGEAPRELRVVHRCDLRQEQGNRHRGVLHLFTTLKHVFADEPHTSTARRGGVGDQRTVYV